MTELAQVSRRPHDCCNDDANLTEISRKENRVIEQCAVCGRRHYVLEVDQIVIETKTSGI